MKNERTLKMMENYINDFSNGLSPKEIAEKYSLSSWTVYTYLGEIAKKAGVSRDSLLKHPHDEHIMGVRNFEPVEPIEVDELKSYLGSTNERLEEILAQMDVQEQKIDAIWNEIEREVKAWN